jgi:hypothetical protein
VIPLLLKDPETKLITIIFVVVFFLVGVLLRVQAAWGHDGNAQMDQWYRSLVAPDGTSCCNMKDCAPIEARIRDGQWEVVDPTRITASIPPQPVWLPVPPEAVLRRDNQDGRPIACFVGGFLKCFVPPAGT